MTNDGNGFVNAREPTILVDQHTTPVPCITSGGWPVSSDAVFESNVKLSDGVDLLDCTVRPDRRGRFTMGIVNNTMEDIELGTGIVLGCL